MLSALTLMLLLMATRRYGFVWETTILSADVFVSATHALGVVPGWLGFSGPTEAMIRASTDTAYSTLSLAPALAVMLGANIGSTLVVQLLGLESTGPSDFCKCWMAFGLPQINIPLPRGQGELPVGLQVIGGFRQDSMLLDAAQQVDMVLSGL